MRTSLNSEAIAKVIGNGELIEATELRWSLSGTSGSRPRAYGYLETGESAGQVVKLTSTTTLDKYEDDLGFAWLSGTTFADLISQA